MNLHAPRVAAALLLEMAPCLLAAQATRVVIPGVPFISWEEAARLDYHDKNALNPSAPAALGMILRYWGHDLTFLQQDGAEAPSWAAHAGGANASLDSLKRLVAHGIPVVVFTAMTPFAHQVAPQAAALFTMVTTEGLKLGSGSAPRPGGRDSAAVARNRLGPVEFTDSQFSRIRQLMSEYGGFWSGVLGKMWPLDSFRPREGALHLPLRKESLFLAQRVLIGYDDAKRVVVLHCPSFGPAWEVSYEEFDKMWSFMDRSFTTFYPKSGEQVRANKSPTPGYLPRSTKQRAATHFTYGYALEGMGQDLAATSEFRAIQALGEVGKGYEHLAWLELGWGAGRRGDFKAAISAAGKARDLLPEHHRSWLLFAALFQAMRLEGKGCGGHGCELTAADSSSQRIAADARRQAEARCGDPETTAVVGRTLPHDFATFGCNGLNPP